MNNNTPLVSIIVPCYNYGHLISETLDSVKGQSYGNWECIVVDDGSTDQTQHVVQKYIEADSRFRYIYQRNAGLAAARNTGLRLTVGCYIQLLDADDILAARKIERHIAVLENVDEIDLVYGNVFLFDRSLSALSNARKILLQDPLSGTGDHLLLALLEDNMFLVHCAFFRASIIKDVGLFDEAMITCEDWNYWFRCALNSKKFLFLDDPESNVYVRSHGSNMSGNRKNMWIGRVHFHKNVEELMMGKQDKIDSFAKIIEKNKQNLETVSMRLESAYGNPVKGLIRAARMLLKNGDYSGTLRDSLYWIKERILKRV